MRRLVVLVAIVGCGFEPGRGAVVDGGADSKAGDDAATDASLPDPPVFDNGGVGGGPIAGRVDVYVIDEITDARLANATVAVGNITGQTDATGRFVASDPALVGAQTITASLAGYRSEAWIGVAGRHVTIAMQQQPITTVPSATLAGSVPSFAAYTAPAGTYKRGVVAFSQSQAAADAENDVATPAGTNVCYTDCNYTVTTRTGSVSLVAMTEQRAAGTNALLGIEGWAYKRDIAVSAGDMQTGHALAAVADVGIVRVDLPAAPVGTTRRSYVGIELSADETLYLPVEFSDGSAWSLPTPAGVGASTYRLLAFAEGATEATVAIRGGLTGINLGFATWQPSPTMLDVTRASASWMPVAGAPLHLVLYEDVSGAELLLVRVFDGSSAIAVPPSVAVPTATSALVLAVGGTFDVTSFDFATAPITDLSARATAVTN